MTRRREWVILGLVIGVYLVGLGVLAGIVSERFRFDDLRASVLRQLEAATQRARSHAMDWEREVHRAAQPAATPTTDPEAQQPVWRRYVDVVDAALATHDVGTAARAWREAYGAALRTRTWRPLLEVGDAVMRIARVDGHRAAYTAHAREAYVEALTRARAERSVDGVLRVAEAFSALGDHQVVEECVRVAEQLGVAAEHEVIVRLRARGQRPSAKPPRHISSDEGPALTTSDPTGSVTARRVQA